MIETTDLSTAVSFCLHMQKSKKKTVKIFLPMANYSISFHKGKNYGELHFIKKHFEDICLNLN